MNKAQGIPSTLPCSANSGKKVADLHEGRGHPGCRQLAIIPAPLHPHFTQKSAWSPGATQRGAFVSVHLGCPWQRRSRVPTRQ